MHPRGEPTPPGLVDGGIQCQRTPNGADRCRGPNAPGIVDSGIQRLQEHDGIHPRGEPTPPGLVDDKKLTSPAKGATEED